MEKMIVECCPYCETEIEMRWDTDKQGFKAFCPVCGKRLMLCDECEHRNGEFIGGCDYNNTADTCKHNKAIGWLKDSDDYDNAKTLMLEFKVLRHRPSVTQQEAQVFCNGHYVTSFSDEPETIKDGEEYYKPILGDLASKIPDEDFIYAALWHKRDFTYQLSTPIRRIVNEKKYKKDCLELWEEKLERQKKAKKNGLLGAYWVSWLAQGWKSEVSLYVLCDSCDSWDETMKAVVFIEGNHRPVCLWVEREINGKMNLELFRVYVDCVGLHHMREVWRNERIDTDFYGSGRNDAK